jgi:hypothetical protein
MLTSMAAKGSQIEDSGLPKLSMVDEIPCSTEDRVRVNAEVPIELREVADLSKLAHSQTRDGCGIDRTEKSKGVGMTIEDGHDRRRPMGREEQLEYAAVSVCEPPASLQRPEDQVGRRETDDIACNTVVPEPIGCREDCWGHRASKGQYHGRVADSPAHLETAGDHV